MRPSLDPRGEPQRNDVPTRFALRTSSYLPQCDSFDIGAFHVLQKEFGQPLRPTAEELERTCTRHVGG